MRRAALYITRRGRVLSVGRSAGIRSAVAGGYVVSAPHIAPIRDRTASGRPSFIRAVARRGDDRRLAFALARMRARIAAAYLRERRPLDAAIVATGIGAHWQLKRAMRRLAERSSA